MSWSETSINLTPILSESGANLTDPINPLLIGSELLEIQRPSSSDGLIPPPLVVLEPSGSLAPANAPTVRLGGLAGTVSLIGDRLLGSLTGVNTAITAEGVITINNGGDFDGNPLQTDDDALIYAGRGFTINRSPILPVQRDAAGNAILDASGKPILVENAITVTSGYSLLNAPDNPYSGLVPPQVVTQRTVDVPAYSTIRDQELATRIPANTTPVVFESNRQPLNNAEDWARYFPTGGTADRPTVVRVVGEGLIIPDRVALENTMILVDRGNILFNGSGHQLNNVVLVAQDGSVELSRVQATDLTVLASRSINMNREARFGGITLLANGDTNGITFNGATFTTTDTDLLTVISQGRVTYNADSDTRGQFISVGDFSYNSTAELVGSIGTKSNIYFNSTAKVTALVSEVVDRDPPELTIQLANDTGASVFDRLTFDPTLTGTVTDSGRITQFFAGLNGQPLTFDVLSDLQNGRFSFTRDRLAQINGGILPDGNYTLRLQAQDQQGNRSSMVSFSFDLDTTAPSLDLNLSPAFDSAPLGDRQTLVNPVTLAGQTEAGLTVSLQPTGVTATATSAGQFTFADVSLQPGNNLFTVSATDLAGNQGVFSQTITRTSTDVRLQEETFFSRAIERTFTIPASASALRFSFADLQFDTTDPNAINDAFEAALVDANGNSLVHTIAQGRDAFFNLTEGQSAALANGTTLNGQTVTLNLAGVAPGTEATLILRLVNNDADTTTAVQITDLEVVQSNLAVPGGVVSSGMRSPNFAFLSAAEYAQFSDVSASFAAEYGQTSFNADTEVLYTELAVRNAGQYRVDTPLLVAVTRISDPSVRVANAQGITPDGLPYFDFSDLAPGQALEAGMSTAAQTIAFLNPNGVQFDYELVFLGRLTQSQLSNQAPEFTSTPIETAVVGQPYVYAFSASDANNNSLTYTLLSAPAGMTIDPNTGRLTWLPIAADVGSQSVILQVDDGAGGLARQSFNVVTQLPNPSNYAPVITSNPITVTGLNQSYSYDVDAIDPDGDLLTYSLLNGPQGMAIDPTTGLITWSTVNQMPDTYAVSVRATDRFGNASEAQTFALNLSSALPGEIRGIVWEDLNRNGVRDSDLIQGANPDVVFIADVSFSADDPFIGSPVGDLNGDRAPNTILDAEIAGFIALNRQLIRQGLGQTADVSVISFAGSATTLDMDPVQPGRQVATKAAADRNNNGILDVEEALRSLRTGPFTNFEVALQAAETVFTTLGTASGDGNLIFLSDGVNTIGGAITDELARLRARGVNLSAFGVGQGAALNDGDSLADDLNLIDRDARIFTSTDELLGVFGGLGGGQSVLEPGQANVRVYLDLNNNGVFEPDEPSQVTADAASTTSTTFSVPGTDVIFLAGRTDITIPPLGESDPSYPLQRFAFVIPDFLQETKPKSVAAAAGDIFTFSATGTIDYNLGSSAPNGSDGLFNYAVPGLAGVSPYNGPFAALVGVFLNDQNPAQTSAPAAIDYSTLGNSFQQLTPQVGQVFFIGDGRTGTGTGNIQQFIAPSGATRLFVGIADGRDDAPRPGLYEDNDGAFTVTINRDRASETGEYRFTGLQPGTYTVREVVPRGYTQTFPGVTAAGEYEVTLGAGQTVGDRNFGNTLSGSTANRAPAFISTAPANAVAGQRFRYNATAADPDGDSLTYDLLQAPAGMAVDAQRGVVVWQPASTQVGEQDVILRVRDGLGGSSVQTFRLTVGENQAPQITSLPTPFARLNTAYQYQVAATDPEGQPIAFSLLSQPEGMTIDPQTGLIQWIPTAVQSGDYRVTVAAQDSQGALGRQSFTVTAGANFAPIVTSTPTETTTVGQTYRYDLQAIDPDGDPIRFTLAQAPQAVMLDALGRLSWTTTPADVGTYTIALLATDTTGASTTQTFNLSVQADQQAPLVDLTANQATIERGKAVTFTIASSDNVGVQALNLTLNGNPVAIGTGGITTVQLDDSGLYQVVATAIDAAGNVGTDTLSLRVIDPRDTNAPLIEITSPTTRTTVTTLTEIFGSITDTDLESYRVEYAPFSTVDLNNLRQPDSDFVTLTQGTTSVQNGVLAQFDPTLLLNDDYVIRVTAQDVNGNLNTQGIVLSVNGENKLGNFRIELNDLSLPLNGIPITVTRVYDTLQANQISDFGYGWSLGVQDARIQESVPTSELEGLVGSLFVASPFQAGTRVYLTNPDGERVGFTFNPVIAGSSFFGPLWKPQFTPDAGVFDTLSDVNDSVRLVRASNGSFVFPLFGFAYNPSEYNLTTKTGLTYRYDQFEGLEEIRDRNGNTVTFTDAGITSSTGTAIQFARDPQGRITQIIDPVGNAIRYTYDTNGDLVRVVDQADLTTTLDYLDSRPHYLEEIVDPRGKAVIQTQYDAQGRVIATTDALGRSINRSVDVTATGSTTTEIDPLGNAITTVRDDRGNILSITNSLGATTRFTYDSNNNLASVTDARGFTTTRTFDDRGNVTRITDALGNVQSFTYDPFSNITAETDGLGRTTRFVYDANGNLAEVIDAANQRGQFGYDNLGRVTSFTDANNRTTTYSYGNATGAALGKPTLITFPDRGTQQVEYNPFGQITRLVDENGHETRFITDSVGRLIAQRDALGNETTYTYDSQLITRITDPLGNVVRFEYDDTGRLIRQIDAAGGITQFTYDALGKRTSETDPLGRTTTITYRADGLTDSITDAAGNITRFEYDLTGNQTAVIDTLGQRTTFTYDPIGQQIRKTDPLGNVSTYVYDAAGNLIETIDRNNQQRTFTYNLVDQLIKETWWSTSTPIRSLDFTYDAVGNLLTATDPDSALTFSYDSRDRLTQVENLIPGLPVTTLTYTYDRAGNRLSVIDNLGVRVDSTYDPRNLLTSQTWQGGGIDSVRVEYAYNARGNRTEVERFADALGSQLIGRSTSEYDALQRLTELTHLNATGTVLANYDHTYDAASSLTSETYNRQTTTYTYDRTNQLTSVDRTTLPDERYTYDANGNPTNGGFVVSANNQITSDGTFNYGYDNEGNLVQKTAIATGATTTYEYDYRNRLVGVVDRDTNGAITQTVEFTYDALDRRISKSVDGEATYFVNDGETVWADLNPMGAVLSRYLHGAEVDELIARYQPGEGTDWYLTDRLGSIRDAINAAGNLINQISYNSFGEILSQTNSAEGDRFTFAGREYDAETGLYYNRARYYDSTLGRFISEDPLGFGGQDTNLYRYVANNPINATDPSGLLAIVEYAGLLTKVTLGPTGSSIGAISGGLLGFGVTSLVFIGEILGIANAGGDVLADWGAAISRTEAKLKEITSQLKQFQKVDTAYGLAKGFVSGAGLEAKISLNVEIPNAVKQAAKLAGVGIPPSRKFELKFGGFEEGYKEGLKYLSLVGPSF